MASNKRKLSPDASNEPPEKRQKLNPLCSQCKKCTAGDRFHRFQVDKLNGLCCSCHSFKYKNKRQFWKSITFKSSTSNILNYCNISHKYNICKRQSNTLCDACHNFVKQKNKYSKAIDDNLKLLLPMKYILLSYLMCSRADYFNHINDPKYQLMMDEWHHYSILNNNLNKSISILKKMMKNLSIDNFIDLLCQLQPWLNVTQLCDILDFQLGNKGLMQIKKDRHSAYKGTLSKCCNGCAKANLEFNTGNKCWICHMAIKTMLLMYFVIDLFEDDSEYFWSFENFIQHHSVMACPIYWSIDPCSATNLFGCHAIKNHIMHEIKKSMSDYEMYLLTPPIISKERLTNVKMEMLRELSSGWHASHHGNRFHGVGVWVCDEMSNQEFVFV